MVPKWWACIVCGCWDQKNFADGCPQAHTVMMLQSILACNRVKFNPTISACSYPPKIVLSTSIYNEGFCFLFFFFAIFVSRMHFLLAS